MENKETRDYTGAIFLVLLGTLFLLNTTNVVPWSIWLYLLRFWPIILILAGLKMILPKTKVGNIIMTVVYTLFMLAAGVMSYYFAVEKKVPLISESVSNFLSGNYAMNTESQTQEEYILSEDFSDITSRTLDIFIGASELTLNDEAQTYHLLSKTTYQYEGDIPQIEAQSNEGILNIDFRNREVRNLGFWRFVTPTYDLTLGQNTLPTSLDMTIGAGKATVDLDETVLKSIFAQVGAGDLDMTLGEKSLPESINLEIGAGDVTLTLPQNIGVYLVYNLGVGEISLDTNKIEGVGQNGTYQTTDYDTATKKLTIEAKVGVGSLTIERI
mgnify:CR=1 FL=1